LTLWDLFKHSSHPGLFICVLYAAGSGKGTLF